MRTTRIAVLLSLAVVVLATIPAEANDHRPPKTELRSGAHLQNGKLWSHCWTEPGPNEGETTRICRDYIWVWPTKERVRSGARASILFKTSVQPNEIDLQYWRKVDENDAPNLDRTRQLEFTLTPVMDGTEVVAYRARFTLPGRPGHMYLQAFGTWPDQDGSEDVQDAFFHFHLFLRS